MGRFHVFPSGWRLMTLLRYVWYNSVLRGWMHTSSSIAYWTVFQSRSMWFVPLHVFWVMVPLKLNVCKILLQPMNAFGKASSVHSYSNSSVHISYTGFKSNCSSLLYVLLLRNVQQHSQASLLIHERPAFAFLLSVSAPFPPVRCVTEPRCCRGRRPCSHASPPWSLESIGLQGTRVFHEDLMDTIIDHWKMIGYD